MAQYNNQGTGNMARRESNNNTRRYDKTKSSDNAYLNPKQNPKYSEKYTPQEIADYKEAVYDRISELLLSQYSKLEPYIEGNDLTPLQKTYKDGKLIIGRDVDDLMVIYESDTEANNEDAKIEPAILNWLEFADLSQLQLDVVITAEVTDEGIQAPPNLILKINDGRPDFNLNQILGTLDIKGVSLRDNVSQFMALDKVSTDISRKKLSENVDVDFSELSPITYTHLIDRYNKAKMELPLFRHRADDFFKEYINSDSIPISYRIEKFFEEYERIKEEIPPGALAPYNETMPLLTELTDEELFGWETHTYLVAESQKIIGTTNPIYSQADAVTWDNKIMSLTAYGAEMSGSWDACEKRLRALSDFSNITGSLEDDLVLGCTDPTAMNYNSLADSDDGSCQYPISSILVYAKGTGMNMSNWNTDGNRVLVLGEGDENDIEGRTVYNEYTGRGHRLTVISAASIEGGEWDGTTLWNEVYDTYNDDNARNEMAEDILTGEWALNDLFVVTSYDAVGYNDLLVEALRSVGGCYPRTENGIGSTFDDGLASPNARTPYVLVGSKGLGPCNGYEAVGDDGEFTPPSEITVTYDPLQTTEGGWDMDGPQPIYGCTDDEANNYNEFADTDDGSCTYDAIVGCTDPLAENYDMDAEEDDGTCTYVVVPAFEETFDNWKDIYSPSDYFFRSVESPIANQQYSIGQVLKTDGPEGADDTAVRIYRTRPSGQWPGALYNPNTDTEKIDPTWVGAEARKPRHIYLEEDRTYTWSGWGRCNTTDGNAHVFVGDTRGGDSENNWDYSWRQSGTWQTNGEWEYHEFDFTPVRNKHVSKGKWKIDYILKLDQEGKIDNFSSKPSFNPTTTPNPNSDYIVKTEYWTTIDKDWGTGNVVTNYVHDFGEGSGQLANAKNDVMIRVTGMINVTNPNYKKFAIVHDDGVRVYIDGELEIDEWRDTGATWSYSDEIYMSEGLHEVEIHWYENGSGADLRDFRKAGGSYGTVTDSMAKNGDLVEHAPKDLITDDMVQQTLYPGVMMNMYLYPGTTNGGETGQYCDYANIKVTPQPKVTTEARRGGLVRKLGYGGNVSDKTISPLRKKTFTTPIPSNYNPGPTNEVNPTVNILRDKFESGGRTAADRKVIRKEKRKSSNLSNVSLTNYSAINKKQTNNQCEKEIRMLERISNLPIDKMFNELQMYLSLNEPCLNVNVQNIRYQDGGSSRGCCPTACGDMNGDGMVNILDVVGLVGVVLGDATPTSDQIACVDNGDGMLNILDIVGMVGQILDGTPYNLSSCEVCSDSCTGIIGCDGVCYTEVNGTMINGPGDISFLPPSARYDKAGMCGGMTNTCNQACSSYDMSNCDGTFACYQIDIVEQNQDGEYINVLGPLETTACQYDYGDQICMYGGTGERGGLFGGIR